MGTYIKCKKCNLDFKSCVQIAGNEESFLKAATNTVLSNNTERCSKCGESVRYDGVDYFWKED